MTNKYSLSKKADKEISNILEYSYLNFGLAQAVKYKTSLEHCFQLLADNPNIGRQCDYIRQGYFRHEHESHIIFYTLKAEGIFIATIIHNKMDLTNRSKIHL